MSRFPERDLGRPTQTANSRVGHSTPSRSGLQERLAADIAAAGGEIPPDPELEGAIGTTMFDLPRSVDNTVTVLLPQENAQRAASQSLVRIKSRKTGDGRSYLGMVTAGPFAEPNSLRGDSSMLVTVATRGGIYQPPYHGRIQLSILGEELANGTLCPPRLRPLPNSPAFALSDQESAAVLKTDGDIRLGLVVGYKRVVLGIPSDRKFVLPRHTAVLGTTGGGKSTTIARLVQQAQQANMAVILLDVEGEYTHLHEPTRHPEMLAALQERGLQAAGLPDGTMTLYHLVGRGTANPDYSNTQQFSLQFARISPYSAVEILGLTEPQEHRFLRAYDIAKEVMRDLGIFPAKGNADQERFAMEIDEFERGYPRLTLSFLMDVVAACLKVAETPKREERSKDNEKALEFAPCNDRLATPEGKLALRTRIYAGPRPDSAVSWRALLGRLSRLSRLKVFDSTSRASMPLNYKTLLKPGSVSIIDLSDSGMSELTNLVIADLLRGVQEAQNDAYQQYENAKRVHPQEAPPTRTLIIIEEAHEFLSAERIEKTKILFEQVARIAKRGRKRWLGLVFVTQLPQHLPRQVFGLVNSYILHKITDSEVVSTLRRTVSGIDDGLWDRLPGLAPGQAIVSFPHMTRPLLVSIDPTPAELRLSD
ncbi:MAG TPA: ATP-binding protein [Gemmataceae bacterium]|nr:ATP-binding protein [Gemmataceae bacterium]